VAVALGADPFDHRRHPPLSRNWRPVLDSLPVRTLVVWDDHYAQVEEHLPLAMLQEDARFRLRWQESVLRDPTHLDRGRCHLAIFERVE